MHRIDHATRKIDLFGAGKHGFTEGNPVAGEAATVVTADILNSYQQEICEVIEAAGLTLDKADREQLRKAIEEHQFKTPKARTRWIMPSEGMAASQTNAGVDTIVQWRTRLGASGPGAPFDSKLDFGLLAFDLTQILPTGAVLTAVNLLVDPGAERASAPNRMRATITELDFPTPPTAALPSGAGLGSDEQDASGHALQYLSITGLSATINRSDKIISLQLEAGNEGGVHVPDQLIGIHVSYNDPGPRNH